MKQFFEFIPLIVFFAVYKMVDIYAATGALMVTTGLMVAYTYLRHKKVEKMHLITFIMVMVFGAFTLILHDDAFIKWKVTVIYVLFAIALLVSQYLFKKPIIKSMLGKEITLPDNVWNNLNLAWALFFAVLGAVNVYVAFYMSQDIWVNFKVFGLLAATIVFTIFSGVYIYKYLPKDESDSQQQEEE